MHEITVEAAVAMLTLRLLATGAVIYRALSANVLIDEVEEILE